MMMLFLKTFLTHGLTKKDIDVNFEEFDENVDYDSPTNKETVDENFLRKKKSKVLDIDMKSDNIIGFNPDVGQKFFTTEQLQLCIKGYAIHYGYDITCPRKTPKVVLVVCCKRECPWRLWASFCSQSKYIRIKTLEAQHTCTRSYTCRAMNSKFLAHLYQHKILSNPTWKMADFKQNVLETYEQDVTILL
ncbi:hypothetical protein FRX31_010737 [Thalictrum thalictroides]|uniref:Transposase MuDR plant domain-containing protein n=1 Tax=Thalictrum thalictroides TaxID=46969 RepID=A0A7J6WQN5_THATH|nr:hypothetical protein FRX31_010737 [Thalictrum thalictroides]